MTDKLKVILVDDEKRSIDNLYRLLSQYCMDTVEISAKCRTINEAYKAITKHQPHLVFLDIDMPPVTGFDLLKRYEDIPFEVVFVTAYDFYAIDAIKFSAAYYILKPVKIEELKEAIEKVRKTIHKRTKLSADYFRQLDLQSTQFTTLLIKSLKKSILIQLEDIIYLKAEGSYSTLFLRNGQKITCSQKSIKDYELMLMDKGFFRSHKSYLVSLREIECLDKSDSCELLLKNKTRIPLAFRRKIIFERLFYTK
ncbi:MAG: LytR/AlgR family response regulator transcription factor [Chitinophagales bacterium]|jgi:two-component system LytT family response regulator|nr:LytTR family DNA-binding domain-containing protein [Sphingobacteriales bacterium]